MDMATFKQSLKDTAPAPSLSLALQALWHDGRGDWDASHDIAQDMPGVDGAWIHAYLHRKEGDLWNADYWYQRAGKKRPSFTIEEEWEQMVLYFLENG